MPGPKTVPLYLRSRTGVPRPAQERRPEPRHFAVFPGIFGLGRGSTPINPHPTPHQKNAPRRTSAGRLRTHGTVRFRLVPVELQAQFKLANGVIGRANRFHAMPAEIMRGMFHVLFRPAK